MLGIPRARNDDAIVDVPLDVKLDDDVDMIRWSENVATTAFDASKNASLTQPWKSSNE